MEFPKLKKRIRGLISAAGRAVGAAKTLALSAGLITAASGTAAAAQPKVPADPRLTVSKSDISKYSTKFLLRAAGGTFSRLFAQHRSHSSHSSHRSHSSHYSGGGHASHASHYSSSSPTPSAPSHASHYSSVGPSSPPARSTPSPSVVTPPATNAEPAARTAKSTVVMSDYFNDESTATEKWELGALTAGPSFTDEEISVSEEGGRLQISPRAGITGRSYYGYVSKSAWDMTACHARVEVAQVTGGSADTIFAIGSDSNNWFGFVVEGGKLYLQNKAAGRKNSRDITFSLTRHRFLRLRHEAAENKILWEGSGDGQKWETLRSLTPQIPLASLRVYLGAGTYQNETNPGTAAFDNFRLVVHTEQ
jgi:hypothetical protein